MQNSTTSKAKFLLIFLLLVMIVSCSTNPYRKTNRFHVKRSKNYSKILKAVPPNHNPTDTNIKYGSYWVGTTNFGLRKPNYVIIHHTAQKAVDQTLRTFTLPRTSVSSHYVISREGEVFHMLNDYYRAWHAGDGSWGNSTDLNSSSIGIELANNGYEPFPKEQIESLLDLLKVLKKRYNIPDKNFIGHSDIAPTRKVDPNVYFPWDTLAEEGFGLWYDTLPTPHIQEDSSRVFPQTHQIKIADGKQVIESNSSDSLPPRINPKLALRIIGYDVSDMEAAIRAFKLHFVQKNISSELSDEDLRILYNLYKKYL